MRVLILGGDGMLGHQVFKHLRPRHEVRVTLHQDLSVYSSYGLFDRENAYDGLDLSAYGRLEEVLADFGPEAAVNCAGIVKQRPEAEESIPSLEINALLPHRLAVLLKSVGARLVHMSTDCVFSGKKGNYKESDPSDAGDLYGRSKYLGEVDEAHCLTLRTSIIGPELRRKTGLLEWFLAQRGTINGYTNHIFTGLTTMEMSRIIEMMILEHPQAAGVYHVSSDPISKYDLLSLIKEKMDLETKINPYKAEPCDRSLDSTRFRREFGYAPPTWGAMVEELCEHLS